MLNIIANKREEKEKLKEGEIKAVYYGSGVLSTPISISLNEFIKIWNKAGESSAVKLKVGKVDMDVMIHDVQLNPITSTPIHVDFLVIDINKKITVSIPLEFTGISPAVKSGVGVLVKVLREIEIEGLPKDLPQNISVDTSSLVDLDSAILVSDLILPKTISVITKSTEVIAAIAEQKEEKEEVPQVDLSAIEVEKKGKKEVEAEAPTTE